MTDKKSNDSRRKLLKSIAAGSGAVVAGKTLPDAWTKPVVDSVILPAHAETSGCIIYAVSEVPFGNGSDALTVCATVCGDSADVTLSVSFDSSSSNRRAGTIPVGGATGKMAVTQTSPTCSSDADNPARDATLTDLTDATVVYTMIRGKEADGPLVVTLKRVDSCPTFPSLDYVCDGD